MEDILIPLVAITGVFGSATFIAWVVLESIRNGRQTTLTREFTNKLLDRVTSGQELSALMTSDAGERLMGVLSGRTATTAAHARILKAMQTGFVLFTLGGGLFLFGFLTPTLSLEANQTVNVFGTIAASLGLGLLLAAGAAYRLSKSFGLLDGQNGSGVQRFPSA
jgi:hypothetical protein